MAGLGMIGDFCSDAESPTSTRSRICSVFEFPVGDVGVEETGNFWSMEACSGIMWQGREQRGLIIRCCCI